MKRARIWVCMMIYVLLTAVKLVLPASAAELRTAVQHQISRSDPAIRAASLLQSITRSAQRPEAEAAAVPVPVSPLEEMEAEHDRHVKRLFSGLPGSLLHAEPSAEVEAELERDAAMDAAYAAREAFLASQEAFSDRALPANVSYDIPALPFAAVTPVSGYTSSGFGYRMHPIQNTVKFHYGTDFAAGSGTEICAFADGTVLAAGQDAGYGNYVKLDHGDGFVTLYGHCSELLVSQGDAVSAGQVIARVGATGHATGPHLHFELIHEGVYLNPEFYLSV